MSGSAEQHDDSNGAAENGGEWQETDQKPSSSFSPSVTSLRPAEAPRFPIMIAEWQRYRHKSDLIRVSFDEYNRQFTIDVRVWWQDAEGVYRPSRSGLTLGAAHLPMLAQALSEALQHAEQLGVVQGLETAVKDKTGAEQHRRYRDRHRNNGGAKT